MTQPSATTVTAYFDSSALVKRYMTEIGTTWVQAWCDDPAQTIAVAEIGLVEIAAAFAGKLRGAGITSQAYRDARTDLEADAQDEYVLVDIDRSIVNDAIQLTEQHRLRGYDAIHLACAIRLNNALVAHDLPALVLVSADDELLAAAAAEGIHTVNPNDHP